MLQEPQVHGDQTSSVIGRKLAPFNPTNIEAAHIALSLLCVTDGDILYDLGCGDGRLLVEACRMNGSINAVGVEYDLALCEKAQSNVNENGCAARTRIIHGNVLDVDFAPATVIFIYLVPEGLQALKDKLCEALSRGVRIVTYVFSIPGLVPQKVTIDNQLLQLSLPLGEPS